jgi:aminoglycoside phosphotransferase family enzyme/predicted kinase
MDAPATAMNELSVDDQAKLVAALMSALAPPLGEPAPQRIETHASNVILAGDFAYKIKKPVDFGFLNFTTLARRKHFCDEEIRLNGRLAPQIYLDVIAITGTLSEPRLGHCADSDTDSHADDSKPLEYAVRMRRFSQDCLMSHLAETHALDLKTIDALAAQIVDFHAQAARTDSTSEFSTPEAVLAPVQENFAQIKPLLSNAGELAQLEHLERWSLDQYRALREEFAERGSQGWIRECHGDMHLGNMALIDKRVLIFDGIEFNQRMRWTDVLGDIAFLAMDLDDRGLSTHSNRFLNAWLENSGDYSALPLLAFYRVYRAMVRAKIAALRLSQTLTAEAQKQALAEYRSYTALAERYTRPAQPKLCITHGLSGSGKSTVAAQVVDRYGMLRIRSDVERKRLHGLNAEADSGSALGAGIYDMDSTRATYDRLAEIAETALTSGYAVIVDATFLKNWQRSQFAALAAHLELPFVILDIKVPLPILKRWISERRKAGADPSEADFGVLEQQIATREPLSDDEREHRCAVNAVDPDIETLFQHF